MTTQVEGTRRSLHREWSRAFNVVLALLIAAGFCAFVGITRTLDDFGGTTSRLVGRTAVLTALSTSLISDENNAHAVVDGTLAGGLPGYLVSQQNLFRAFDRARAEFPAGPAAVALTAAGDNWQATLEAAHLRGATAPDFTPPTPGSAAYATLQTQLAAGGARSIRSLDHLQVISSDSVHHQLARNADLERVVLGTLTGVFLTALGVSLYFRRRMSRDLLEPVAGLHEGVVRLEAGVYDTPITVHRNDELGELATAFNGMAAGLRDSHLALDFRAKHDSLTGMPNRASLVERLTTSFTSGGNRRANEDSVLFIDIDDFKVVNDTLGHEGGDDLLTEFAARLTTCVRPLDMVARLGGDEFAILVVEQGAGATAGVEIAERILDALRVPFVINTATLTISVSIGLTQHRPGTLDAAELLRQADFAMYMAKGRGKNRYELFESDIHRQLVGRAHLRAELGTAVSAGELRVHYQPVADLGTGEVVGVEALVRWQHPSLGLLAPAEFIPLAEQTGELAAIGRWLIGTAATQVAGWRHSMRHCDDLWVAINLSGFHFPDPHGRHGLEEILADPMIEAPKVVLGVTETALSEGVEGRAEAVNALKGTGVRLAIDDFGAGMSSLMSLNAVDADILRLDRSVASIAAVPMLEGIIGLAGRLDMTVVAKGIETMDQRDRLRSLGCRFGQGPLLAGPMAPSDMEALLAAGGLLAHDRPLRALPTTPGPTPRHS